MLTPSREGRSKLTSVERLNPVQGRSRMEGKQDEGWEKQQRMGTKDSA